MLETMTLLPGIRLRCFRDSRFKQGALSLQLVRPMAREEAALNALLPAVLLRGSRDYPDIRAITDRLDELYGASVGTTVRRVGDYQTTGLYCGFMEDRFAFQGDKILEPMTALLQSLLLDPLPEEGAFRRDYVEGEKKNLISTIDAQRNDKRAYAGSQLIKNMCRGDSFGIPRLGTREQVAAITAEALYRHYRKILRESRIDIFYVGSLEGARVKELLLPLFAGLKRNYVNLPDQTHFHDAGPSEETELMEVAQGKLALGFVTPITLRSPEFAAMQVLNLIFGGGMTSKLFMNIREKQSLCYDISSGYQGAKGILTVAAGIDSAREPQVRREVLRQLEACRAGDVTPAELESAKQAMLSSLRAVHDSPGAIEGYYATGALSGMTLTVPEYMAAVEAVTREAVAEAARTVRLHSAFFLKGAK